MSCSRPWGSGVGIPRQLAVLGPGGPWAEPKPCKAGWARFHTCTPRSRPQPGSWGGGRGRLNCIHESFLNSFCPARLGWVVMPAWSRESGLGMRGSWVSIAQERGWGGEGGGGLSSASWLLLSKACQGLPLSICKILLSYLSSLGQNGTDFPRPLPARPFPTHSLLPSCS